ncbi:MAG: DEAD/DEAH box helicase [Bacteroidota bacterium]|nr:DEAD/DEAH box helicase [Bacteroidota bacterium]MDX5430363.1 DEAD/DEAH box helicase [Bacteroidota bacterium]MDX5469124.1 DEAD/DEAH box helicase [Bacteroidota bacterium]
MNSGRPAPRRNNRSKKESSLNPQLFVKKAEAREEVKYAPTRKIADLPVNPDLVQNLLKKGFEFPTEIQDRSLDALIDRRDLLGLAQTGTGKTGAYLIPIVDGLIGHKANHQVLVIVPTRELAVQVELEFKSITKGLNLYASCFIGGVNLNKDLSELRRPSHIVIGTPGRLIDLGRQHALKFDRFDTLVLDEFDRLLDMGFSRDIQRIVGAMRNREHTLLFSATEDKTQKAMIQELLTDPLEVRVSDGSTSGDHIDQEVIKVGESENKLDLLVSMLEKPEFDKVLVFAETKRGVNGLYKKLKSKGIKVEQIHGDKSQNYRLNALNAFKAGKIQVLLATDVAARGLDIREVSHVINYQAPRTLDAYIHRIGRTGRAGKTGKAYTFING